MTTAPTKIQCRIESLKKKFSVYEVIHSVAVDWKGQNQSEHETAAIRDSPIFCRFSWRSTVRYPKVWLTPSEIRNAYACRVLSSDLSAVRVFGVAPPGSAHARAASRLKIASAGCQLCPDSRSRKVVSQLAQTHRGPRCHVTIAGLDWLWIRDVYRI